MSLYEPYPDPQNLIQWSEWPSERPRPTPEEWAAAVARHHAENSAFRAECRARGKPYMGDCGYSLGFDMATVSRELWWHYFFPDEDMRSEWQQKVTAVFEGGKP